MKAAGSIRAALLTAPAPGAIAVIRIVGEGAWSAVAPILRRPKGDPVLEIAALCPTLLAIVDSDEKIDEALVVLRRAAGLDDIELSVHGGVGVTQRVLAVLKARGIEATSVEALPLRTSIHPMEADVDRALLSCESRRLTQFLLAQRATLPAFLDNAGGQSIDERRAYNARTRAAIRLVAGLRVVLVGAPNVGKSTLANALIGRDRVITADLPGTTRDWVSEVALIDGWPVTLTDTAGIRETTDAIEAEAIRRGREQAQGADLIVVLLDATRSIVESQEWAALLATNASSQIPRVIAINKCDAETGQSIAAMQSAWPDAIAISARAGTGLNELARTIVTRLGLHQLDARTPTGFLPLHLVLD